MTTNTKREKFEKHIGPLFEKIHSLAEEHGINIVLATELDTYDVSENQERTELTGSVFISAPDSPVLPCIAQILEQTSLANVIWPLVIGDAKAQRVELNPNDTPEQMKEKIQKVIDGVLLQLTTCFVVQIRLRLRFH